jgi:hypothetical protein
MFVVVVRVTVSVITTVIEVMVTGDGDGAVTMVNGDGAVTMVTVSVINVVAVVVMDGIMVVVVTVIDVKYCSVVQSAVSASCQNVLMNSLHVTFH